MVAACLLVVVALAGLFTWSFQPAAPFRPAPATASDWIHFGFESAEPSVVIDQLAEAGLVDSPRLMKLYVALLAPGVEFRPRAHLLKVGLSPRQLVQRLAELGPRETGNVTIPEGWNRWQIAQRLETRGIAAAPAFVEAVADPVLLRNLGIAADSAEGYLFPATYEFHLDEDPTKVVTRLVRESDDRWQSLVGQLEIDQQELEALGLDRHEIVILASIVEKETGRAGERPRIARVFLNRLARPEAGTKGRLQSDPTAIYGCAVVPGLASCGGELTAVTPELLRDAGNPYNTYRFAGLPPGPIGNPGEAALSAVLAPARGGELFFVADGKGSHTFSEDFESHKNAVKQLRDRRGRSREDAENSGK